MSTTLACIQALGFLAWRTAAGSPRALLPPARALDDLFHSVICLIGQIWPGHFLLPDFQWLLTMYRKELKVLQVKEAPRYFASVHFSRIPLPLATLKLLWEQHPMIFSFFPCWAVSRLCTFVCAKILTSGLVCLTLIIIWVRASWLLTICAPVSHCARTWFPCLHLQGTGSRTSALNVCSAEAVVQLLSQVQIFAARGTVACLVPLSEGFSRQEYWSGLPFPLPGDLPTQGSNSRLLHLQVDSFCRALRKACP